MTIDERLEALVRSAELHAGMLLDHHERMQKAERRMDKTDAYLRRAIRAGVKEARTSRKRHMKIENDLVRLEELVKVFLERGGNGKR